METPKREREVDPTALNKQQLFIAKCIARGMVDRDIVIEYSKKFTRIAERKLRTITSEIRTIIEHRTRLGIAIWYAKTHATEISLPKVVLSPQQQVLLELLIQDMTDPQIAEKVGTQAGTVATHWDELRKKLKDSITSNTREALAAWYIWYKRSLDIE